MHNIYFILTIFSLQYFSEVFYIWRVSTKIVGKWLLEYISTFPVVKYPGENR